MGNKEKEYHAFLKANGKAVSQLNPGSDEYALSVADALFAVDLIYELQIPILGGDILTLKAGKLMYASHAWGFEYHYLSWYCEKDNETNGEYLRRSCDTAKQKIALANSVATEIGKDCFVVLVIDD